MRLVKVIIITAMLGLAIGFLPKAGFAHDVSVGISFGIPFPLPVVEVYPALPSPPPPPPLAYYPAPIYPRYSYVYGPYYRYYRDHGCRGREHGYYNRGERRYRHHHDDDD